MLTKSTVPPSPHAEGARVLIEKIRALRAEIPHFTTELVDGRALTGGVVPDRFLEATSAAIQNIERLEQAAGSDATTLRDAYAYALAYDPVVQELEALAQFVAHSVRVQRNAAGRSQRSHRQGRRLHPRNEVKRRGSRGVRHGAVRLRSRTVIWHGSGRL